MSEPKLRPEFIKRIKKMGLGKGLTFKSIEELREHLENQDKD